jgi:hypothetical protein
VAQIERSTRCREDCGCSRDVENAVPITARAAGVHHIIVVMKGHWEGQPPRVACHVDNLVDGFTPHPEHHGEAIDVFIHGFG